MTPNPKEQIGLLPLGFEPESGVYNLRYGFARGEAGKYVNGIPYN